MNQNSIYNLTHERSSAPQTKFGPIIAKRDSVRGAIGNTTGSILIWSVMLGFVLTSVFFFFGLRQRANIMVQRDTIAILNARNYLESYANYLEINPTSNTSIDPSIELSITQEVEEIEGMVDLEQNDIEYTFDGDVFVEWNHCEDSLKGNLIVEDEVYESTGGGCPNEEYDDVAGPITITIPLTIETQTVPFRYRIVPEDQNTTLLDNEWHLKLTKDLGYRRVVKVERTFNER